jgi:hypothetical protein
MLSIHGALVMEVDDKTIHLVANEQTITLHLSDPTLLIACLELVRALKLNFRSLIRGLDSSSLFRLIITVPSGATITVTERTGWPKRFLPLSIAITNKSYWLKIASRLLSLYLALR